MKTTISLLNKFLLAHCLLGMIVYGDSNTESEVDVLVSLLPVGISDGGKILTVSSEKIRNKDITGAIVFWSVTNEEVLWELWKNDSSGKTVFDKVALEYGKVPDGWKQHKPKHSAPRKPVIGEIFILQTGYRVTMFLSEGLGDSRSAFKFTENGWVEIPVQRKYLRPLVKHLSEGKY